MYRCDTVLYAVLVPVHFYGVCVQYSQILVQ